MRRLSMLAAPAATRNAYPQFVDASLRQAAWAGGNRVSSVVVSNAELRMQQTAAAAHTHTPIHTDILHKRRHYKLKDIRRVQPKSEGLQGDCCCSIPVCAQPDAFYLTASGATFAPTANWCCCCCCCNMCRFKEIEFLLKENIFIVDYFRFSSSCHGGGRLQIEISTSAAGLAQLNYIDIKSNEL